MVVLSFAAICLLPNANGQQQAAPSGPGVIQAQIKAARVVGQVTVTRTQGAVVILQNNDLLSAGDIVVTGKESSVVLVFSNGSTVSIGQDSRVSVDEFTQDPFAEDVKLSELKEEPTTSHTKLKLTYGELVGNVKKLNGASTFEVQTPVGAAGIRGTTFRLVYRPTGNGQAFFTLSTASGIVIFQGSTGAPVSVPANQQVDIQVTVNPTTGAVQVQVNSTGISDEAKQAIAEQVQQAIQVLGVTNFNALMNQGNGNGPDQDQGQGQNPEQPQTTPGD
jgi:hypothetical protein